MTEALVFMWFMLAVIVCVFIAIFAWCAIKVASAFDAKHAPVARKPRLKKIDTGRRDDEAV